MIYPTAIGLAAAALLATNMLLPTNIWAQSSQSSDPAARQLAPGVLTVVEVQSQEEETLSGPRPLVELVQQAPDWKPNFTPQNETLLELSKNATIRRTIWQFEFAFKPMRLIFLDVPTRQGGTRQQAVWYLLYQIRNKGNHLRPTAKKDKFGNDVMGVESVDHDLSFVPQFALQIHGEIDGRPASSRMIPDRVIPAAVRRIHRIEIRDRKTRLHNSVDISAISVAASSETMDRGVWGVATWPDVDPRADYFSIYVQGVSNAYRWEDPKGAHTEGDPPGTGRQYEFKTLKINFWRPGDTVDEHVREFRLGLPLTQDQSELKRLMGIYRVQSPEKYGWTYQP